MFARQLQKTFLQVPLILAVMNVGLIVHLMLYGGLPFGLDNWKLYISVLVNFILFGVEYCLRWGRRARGNHAGQVKSVALSMIIGFLITLSIFAIIIVISIVAFSV